MKIRSDRNRTELNRANDTFHPCPLKQEFIGVTEKKVIK